MKKILVLIGLLSSMYAIPPCDLPDQKVCAYFYNGPLSGEIIITNMSTDTILVERLHASLDDENKDVQGLTLSPGQNYTVIKKEYDEKNKKKPYYHIEPIKYKIVN